MKLATTVAFPVMVKVVAGEELLANVPPNPDQLPKIQPEAGEAESVMAVPEVYPWLQFFALAVTVPEALGLVDTASV